MLQKRYLIHLIKLSDALNISRLNKYATTGVIALVLKCRVEFAVSPVWKFSFPVIETIVCSKNRTVGLDIQLHFSNKSGSIKKYYYRVPDPFYYNYVQLHSAFIIHFVCKTNALTLLDLRKCYFNHVHEVAI